MCWSLLIYPHVASTLMVFKCLNGFGYTTNTTITITYQFEIAHVFHYRSVMIDSLLPSEFITSDCP